MANHTPKALLKALDARDGHVCSWHGAEARSDLCKWGTLVPQHRLGGMGGSATKHRLSVVVWLCSEMNGLIESDPLAQIEAYQRGIKLRGDVDPEKAEILHAVHGKCLLKDDGTVAPLNQKWW